jgi:uncharacterized protein
VVPVEAMDYLLLLVALSIFFIALLYSSVGHGGASGYIAIMVLAGLAPDTLKPAALVLNILVAGIASYKYVRANAFSWSLLWPLIIFSIPCAYLGGRLSLPHHYYQYILGIVLVYAAIHSFFTANTASLGQVKQPLNIILLFLGGMIGFLSGLVGVGGGIFLSPILLLMRWGETRTVSGVAAVFIFLNSIAGLIGVMSKNPVLPDGLVYWIFAAILGGWIGAEMGSKHLKSLRIRQLIAVVLLVAGIKMLLV